MLEDIDKNTVAFVPNFDDATRSPLSGRAASRTCW
jgi:DNA gyrase/topoisomerase IV subunit A